MKFDLQIFDESRAALLRNAIADYLDVDGTCELMGTGFTSLNERQTARRTSTRVRPARTSPVTKPSSRTRAV